MTDKIDRSKEPALGKKLTLDDGVASDVRIVKRNEKMSGKIERKKPAPKPKVAAPKKSPSSKVSGEKTAENKVNVKNKNQNLVKQVSKLKNLSYFQKLGTFYNKNYLFLDILQNRKN